MIRFTKSKETPPASAPTASDENRFDRVRKDATEARKKADGGGKTGGKATDPDRKLI
jgi:hypothetical protein